MSRPVRLLFELGLRAFPAPFRRSFADGMREAFEAACLELGNNRTRLYPFLLRTTVDMISAGFRERVRSTMRPRLASRSGASRPKIWFSLLDRKLGLRMMGKHPGMTLVTVFALAVGIPVGLTPTHLANALEAPLPVPDGHRVRLLRYWNQATNRPETTTYYDYMQWRDGLSSFEAVGAVRTSLYNVDSEDGLAPPVAGAEATASTFELLRVAPSLGRSLGTADEVLGAPSVVVIGYDLWQSRVGGDPDIIGRDLRIGGVPHTVVGVMPQGFLRKARPRSTNSNSIFWAITAKSRSRAKSGRPVRSAMTATRQSIMDRTECPPRRQMR
ncbi:MAG: ABC transporter permease [Gemmatimonadetes bacterium]|nr:ABC transporter permease [Gemmatimonadota bacterium]